MRIEVKAVLRLTRAPRSAPSWEAAQVIIVMRVRHPATHKEIRNSGEAAITPSLCLLGVPGRMHGSTIDPSVATVAAALGAP